MLIMLCFINILGLTLFIIVLVKGLLIKLNNYIKLSLFIGGIIVYTLLNIAGFLSEKKWFRLYIRIHKYGLYYFNIYRNSYVY